MATAVQHILIVITLTSLSFGAVQGTACQQADAAYFRNWRKRNFDSKALLSAGKNLSYEDVKYLYKPTCELYGNYATKQCFENMYCWCSDGNGTLIDGTFQKGTEAELDCTNCVVGNKTYKKGEYFKISDQCKACKCNGRDVICQKYFCSNKTKLNAQEILELKKTIIIVLYYQYGHQGRLVIVREEDIATKVTTIDVALKYRQKWLEWKFNKLDKNNDDMLNKYEFYLFMMEILRFVKSRKVYDTIFSLIDEDNDNLMSNKEWGSFFDPDEESGSTTIDDEESSDSSGDSGDGSGDISTRSVKSSRSLPEVMKEFVKKLRKQQRMSHSENRYF